MSGLQKHDLLAALNVAVQITAILGADCERIEIAGSIRRKRDRPGRQEVGDIEIVYIPKTIEAPDPDDMFGLKKRVNAVDLTLARWLATDRLAQRLNQNGTATWGEKNKYAVAVKSGIPVDFFATDAKCWWNNLVCRTGSAETNKKIAAAALAQGQTWNPTGPGFSQKFESEPGKIRVWEMTSEREVFEHAGLPYLEPQDR
jgi:DNA polymerase/3'-5' exonuclease PolX